MSKGLEALTDLRNDWCGTTDQKERAYDIIEKELKRLEELKIMYSNCVIEGAKQKKALEIIRKFGNIDMLMFKGELEQEEYDLIKEVLL